MTGIQTPADPPPRAARGPRTRFLPRLLAGLGLAALGVLCITPAALAASTPPSLSFQPSTWTAGPIAAGTTGAQTFTLTNTGGKASGALAITVSGSAAFSVQAGSDSCTGTSLGGGRSCTVTVVYAPASNAERTPRRCTPRACRPRPARR